MQRVGREDEGAGLEQDELRLQLVVLEQKQALLRLVVLVRSSCHSTLTR